VEWDASRSKSGANSMSTPDDKSGRELKANYLSEPGSQVTSWHIPLFLKRLLPRPLVTGLLDLKRRIVARDFPRDIEFAQSPEDGQASASMSIVVPIHDAPRVTLRCLASLEKYAPESDIILVDDASVLGETLEVIQQFCGRNGWKVVRHEKPLGQSAACRAGSSLATRPYLCLLNSDTVVTPWCWRGVKEVFEHDQTIGVAGPSTSNTGNPQSLALAEFLSPCWNDNQICAFAKRLLTQFQTPMVMDLAWISGSSFFIRQSLWEQLGGFDQKLPDYGNEIELCGRIAEKGYRLAWVRNCYIHHFGQQSYRDVLGDEGIRERIRAAEIYTAAKRHSLAP
jgi:GT2 family glycosyltransferase